MKNLVFALVASLLAACAPDSVAVGTPAVGCVTDTPCGDDADCGPGLRCNTSLEAPRCQRLQCGQRGSTCSNNNQCRSLMCLSSSYVEGAQDVCADRLASTAPYDRCEGELVGAPCGPTTLNQWYCRRSVDGSGLQCLGGARSDECPMAPNGLRGVEIHMSDRWIGCAMPCSAGACPTGYVCRNEQGYNIGRVGVCVPPAQ